MQTVSLDLTAEQNTLSEDAANIAAKHGIDPEELFRVMIDVLSGEYDDEDND